MEIEDDLKDRIDKEEFEAAYDQLIEPLETRYEVSVLADTFIQKHKDDVDASQVNRDRALYLFGLKGWGSGDEEQALCALDAIAQNLFWPGGES